MNDYDLMKFQTHIQKKITDLEVEIDKLKRDNAYLMQFAPMREV